MKTLGLLGGTSWVSTVDYYKLLNEGINQRLGGLNFARCILFSLNYADVKKNNDANDWEANYRLMLEACLHLKNSGAEALVLCANTMHLFADRMEQEVGLPVIHIAEATAKEIQQKGLKKVALLGTRITMERDFFTSRLSAKGIETIIPDEDARAFIHASIFNELGRGIVTDEIKSRYLKIISELIKKGAEGIILGCTELPLVVKPSDVSVAVFDTLEIHTRAAVEFALSE